MPLQSAYPARPTGIVTGLTAAGNNQATATPLPLRNGLVEVATVASGTGVVLPVISIPGQILIRNVGANVLAIYPQIGGTIDKGTVNAPMSLPAGNTISFWTSSGTNWYSIAYATSTAGTINSGLAGQVTYYATSGAAVSGQANVLIGAGGQLNLAEIAKPGTQVSGDRWTDSTQHCTAEFDGSATSANCLSNYRVALIYAQGLAAGGTANVTVTATGEATLVDTSNAVNPTGLNLPAGYLNVLGRTLRISIRGTMSTIASAPGNHFVLIKLGTNYIASTALTTLGTSKVNNAFTWDALITVKAIGSSGKIDTTGSFIPLGGSTGAAYAVQGVMNSTASTGSAGSFSGTPLTLDLTQAYTLDFRNNFSVGGTGNSITITHLMVEVVG